MTTLALPTRPSRVHTPPTASVRLTIGRVNPLLHRDELVAFMVGEGHVTFPDLFDRGYPEAVRDGAGCWIGRDASGRIVMSVTRFARILRHDHRFVRAGAIGQLMVAPEYRTFFPALSLIQRVLADTAAEGEADLVYGDADALASPVMQAVNLDHVDDLDRFTLPLSEDRPLANAAARLHLAASRLVAGHVAGIHECPITDVGLLAFAAPIGPADRVLPAHSPTMLRRRLPDFPGPTDHMFELSASGTSPAEAIALVRGPDAVGIIELLVLRRPHVIGLHAIIPALAAAAQALGGKRLQVTTLRNSLFAHELEGAGLFDRHDTVPMFARALTSVGRDAIRDIRSWEITALDME